MESNISLRISSELEKADIEIIDYDLKGNISSYQGKIIKRDGTKIDCIWDASGKLLVMISGGKFISQENNIRFDLVIKKKMKNG